MRELGGDAMAITADVRDADAIDRRRRGGRRPLGSARWRAQRRRGVAYREHPDRHRRRLGDDPRREPPRLDDREPRRDPSLGIGGLPGRIVNVTSTAGLEGNPEMFAYSVSKAGVIGLTLATSHTVACRGILVNADCTARGDPHGAARSRRRGTGDACAHRRVAGRRGPGAQPGASGADRGLPRLATPRGDRPRLHRRRRFGRPAAGPRTGGHRSRSTIRPTRTRSRRCSTQPSAPRSSASRWQASSLPLERPDFPVADLDRPTSARSQRRLH